MHHLTRIRWANSGRGLLAWVLSALLAACGGGGSGGGGSDGVLHVNLSFSGNAQLLHQSTIATSIVGLEGHGPNCLLVDGRLPAGMGLNQDCSVTGTPTQTGNFPITVRLGASGVSNTLDFTTTIQVLGPSVAYAWPEPVYTGSAFNATTLANGWSRDPADTLVYTATGTLPPGVVVDASSGRLSGVPTATGTFTFSIVAQLSRGGLTGVAQGSTYRFTVQPATNYYYANTQAYAGVPFTSAPTMPFPAGSSVLYTTTGLPAGLALDPATGVISGTPSAPATPVVSTVTATLTATDGSRLSLPINVAIHVDAPVSIRYVMPAAYIFQPYAVMPTITNTSGANLAGATYSFANVSVNGIPPGLQLDPATGAITGTPTSNQSISALIQVTMTYNGTTFIVESYAAAAVQ